MSIPTTPAKLAEAARHAEEIRDLHMAAIVEINARYVGSAYRGEFDEEGSGESFPFEFKSVTLPATIFDNPRYSLKARRRSRMGEKAAWVAAALESAVNQWTVDVQLDETLTELCDDFLDLWCVGVVRSEPEPGYDPSENKNLHKPRVYRVPQEWFFFDPMCTKYGLATFAGHKYTRDKDELLEEARTDKEAGWDAKAIEGIKSTTEDLHPDERISAGAPDRNQVLIAEIWVPGAEDDVDDHPGAEAGYNGTIYTHAVEGGQVSEKWIRKPYAYLGPPCGPYVFGGVYRVRNSPFPLSPLIATMDQQTAVELVTASMDQSAALYKRGVFVDEKHSALAERIRDFEHDTVIPIPGLIQGMVVEFEVGGVTAQQIEQREIARERLARKGGISDAMRGQPDPNVKATADAIAADAADTRQSTIKRAFGRVARQVGYIAAWHMYYDSRFVSEIDDEILAKAGLERSPEADKSKPVMFMGGIDTENGEVAAFDDLELEVDVYSMGRVSEPLRKQTATAVVQTLTEAAAVMPQAPFLRWDDILDDWGDAHNIPDMGRYIDMDQLRQMGANLAQESPELTAEPMAGRAGERPAMTRARQIGAANGAVAR